MSEQHDGYVRVFGSEIKTYSYYKNLMMSLISEGITSYDLFCYLAAGEILDSKAGHSSILK